MRGTGLAGTIVNLTGSMFLIDVDVVNNASPHRLAVTNRWREVSETSCCRVSNELETKLASCSWFRPLGEQQFTNIFCGPYFPLVSVA
jgi:hypothetical protein